MSKISIVLTMLIAVLALCMSACSQDSGAKVTASQSNSESVAQTDDSVRATEPSVSGTTAWSFEESEGTEAGKSEAKAQTSSNDEKSAGESSPTLNSGEKAAKKSTEATKAQKAAEQETDSQASRNDASKGTEPIAEHTTASAPQTPKERDNAEVNFNDL